MWEGLWQDCTPAGFVHSSKRLGTRTGGLTTTNQAKRAIRCSDPNPDQIKVGSRSDPDQSDDRPLLLLPPETVLAPQTLKGLSKARSRPQDCDLEVPAPAATAATAGPPPTTTPEQPPPDPPLPFNAAAPAAAASASNAPPLPPTPPSLLPTRTGAPIPTPSPPLPPPPPSPPPFPTPKAGGRGEGWERVGEDMRIAWPRGDALRLGGGCCSCKSLI